MGKRGGYVFVMQEKRHWGRRIFLGILAAVAVLILGLFLANMAINNRVELDSVTITVQNLPSDLENWSILVISDLQGRELGSHQSALADTLKNVNVSCVVLCGDMVGKDGNVEPLLELLDLLPADKPKLLITGDSDPDFTTGYAHESTSVYMDWALQAREHGATLLDEPVCITRGSSNIWFVPEYMYSLNLDSMENAYSSRLESYSGQSLTADQAADKRLCEYELNRIQRLKEVREGMTAKDIQVAVSHTPLTQSYVSTMFSWSEKSEYFSLRNASLILAGHYCGGNWRLPGKGAVYVSELGWWPEDSLIEGKSMLNGIPQYISPGLSANPAETLPGRVFNQPTATIVYLTARMN